jgi:hypothetical protein
MSLANQPSKVLISSDDLEYGSGSDFSISLPEAVVGAKKVDLARAVIPNSLYPIPPYQSEFYYQSMTGVTLLRVLTLNTNRYFGSPQDLVTELNANALQQGQSNFISFSYNSTTARISMVNPSTGQTINSAPKSLWLRPFALNTRLGFTNAGTAPALVATAQMIPNLIRTKVIYVLCNVVLNDSISTDGLRTAIAKVPVNSIFGGYTVFQPPYLNYNRITPQNSYQNITISLIDDQYQPYPLEVQDFSEFELVFKYDD